MRKMSDQIYAPGGKSKQVREVAVRSNRLKCVLIFCYFCIKAKVKKKTGSSSGASNASWNSPDFGHLPCASLAGI
jgi:hypothetical protein